jgi:sn-glycerol 3-phosphate transport system substrate-binding protein
VWPALIAGAAALTAAARAPRAVAAPTIELWHSMAGEKEKLLEGIASDFNAQAGMAGRGQVKLVYVGSYTDGINKLRAALLAGKAPHLAQIYEIGTQVMIDSGAAIPLEDLAKGDASFGLDAMLPQVARYYRVGGKLYSLPFATSNPIIYYNVDWLAKAGAKAPPATWEEMTELAGKLADKKAKTAGLTWPLNSWLFEEFLARQGMPLLDQDNGRAGRATKALYDQDAGVAYVEWVKGMIASGAFANVGRDWDPPEQAFLAGRAAMLITSTSDVFFVSDKAPFKVATAPIPKPKASTAPGGTVVGGNSIWVLKGKPAAEQQVAYEFVRFVASAPVQRKWHVGTGYFPIRKDVIDALEKEGFYKQHPNAKTAIDQLIGSAEVPATQGALMGVFPEAREQVESAVEEALAGKASAKAALAAAAERTGKALARYAKMQSAKSE